MDLETRITKIEERNALVEAEKAWEISALRIAIIMVITYAVAYGVLFVIGNVNPFRNALIPVVGYFLSTQSLSSIKRYWMIRHKTAK